jgi:cell division septal protein FtsQ
MARKSEAPGKSRSWASILGYTVRVTAAGILLVGALFGLNRAERFLVRDSRFILAAPDFGVESSGLQLEGVHNAARMEVLNVFRQDFGRSIYLLPLSTRREQLTHLDWVRDASVARVWPNQVCVRIHEREPVAYMQYPTDEAARIVLIDADGVILRQPLHAKFRLPVLAGIGPAESQVARKEKARRLSLVMKDLGESGDRVSEMDVGDKSNIRITVKADRRAMVLLLGDQDFGNRFQMFLNHYSEIQRRLPGAKVLDLRLEDRITAVEDGR